ncbi:MAG: L-ascorbate metabolism protein UlaG (beta-lactamase superfamily) [Glaciecola sp.]|jgi:L-ascorbate metabolism protein UlaG (beta-lactamase superfamily)
MKKSLFPVLLGLLLNSCSFEMKTDELLIHPISHGSLIIEYGDEMIYIDPVGEIEDFKNFKRPTLILITDIHGDHLNLETLEHISDVDIPLLIPEAVNERFNEKVKGKRMVINNGETISIHGMDIEAIPMYNLREEALQFHEKGRGNGYVVNRKDTRIYISGDTEDIPEMRALKNIDIAFVCMNLPWTMTIESAADAVLEFKPQQVFPYHYRGTNGFSDIEKFKSIINSKNKTIKVNLLEWYKE